MICRHPTLHFDKGGMHVVCPSCKRRWGALDTKPERGGESSVMPDFSAMTDGLTEMDKRHDPLAPRPKQ